MRSKTSSSFQAVDRSVKPDSVSQVYHNVWDRWFEDQPWVSYRWLFPESVAPVWLRHILCAWCPLAPNASYAVPPAQYEWPKPTTLHKVYSCATHVRLCTLHYRRQWEGGATTLRPVLYYLTGLVSFLQYFRGVLWLSQLHRLFLNVKEYRTRFSSRTHCQHIFGWDLGLGWSRNSAMVLSCVDSLYTLAPSLILRSHIKWVAAQNLRLGT